MNRSTLFFTCLASTAIGALFFAINYEWIVIRFWQQPPISHYTLHTKRKIDLYYWHTHRWHKESQEILWAPETAANLEAVINCWLTLMDSERIMPKKVSLETALLTPSTNDALVSFDRTPFSKSWSIEKKWMLIESLLKTVHENGIAINTIQFLIAHEPINDPHLDFSYPWPMHGFMQSQLQ